MGKVARNVASRAGKAATKGANKMASALKKKLRHQSDTGEDQADTEPLKVAYGRMDGAGEDDGAIEDDRERPEEKSEGDGLEAATPDRSVRQQEQRAKQETWDAAAFRNVRPLQCESIWDIPTSRIPEPQPEPAVQEREAACLAEDKARRGKLPTVLVSISGPNVQRAVGGGRQRYSWRIKICAVVAVSAVIGATLVAAT